MCADLRQQRTDDGIFSRIKGENLHPDFTIRLPSGTPRTQLLKPWRLQ